MLNCWPLSESRSEYGRAISCVTDGVKHLASSELMRVAGTRCTTAAAAPPSAASSVVRSSSKRQT